MDRTPFDWLIIIARAANRKVAWAVPGLASVFAAALWGTAAGAGEAQFKTPSANIYCAFDDYDGTSYIRCDIMNFTPTSSHRPADCDLDWGDSFSVTADAKRGQMVCHGDTVISPDALTLSYGDTFERGGISCTSEKRGLTCQNQWSHGFFLSRAKQKLF